MPVNYREYYPAYTEAMMTARRLLKEEARSAEEKDALNTLINIMHSTHLHITSNLDHAKLSTDLAQEAMHELEDSAMGCCGAGARPY